MALAITDWATTTLALYGVGGAALATSLVKLRRRLDLSQAKHKSLAGHARIARRLAGFVPFYEYSEAEFFCSDQAPADVAARRRAGFERLAALYRTRFAEAIRRTADAAESISDLQFTDAYRVPFQYSRYVRAHLPAAAFMQSSEGVTVTDLDGNHFYDVSGSYGVNLLGYDFYKGAIERGAARVRDLGPVLGPYHPLIVENVNFLKEISGLDEVSFHMSGTEAVMQAVRLARYHTRRSHLVRFCGAYHGWWGDVQPGMGNPRAGARDLYVARNVAADAARPAHAPRHRLRAGQSVAGAASERDRPRAIPRSSTAAAAPISTRRPMPAGSKQLRQVCSERGIVLIFDEVFVGFRLAQGGAQEYFGVRADLVTYGKTLGGGLPIGVVCGRGALMKRFRDDRPADICFARGTFNSHPYVMGAMNEFLRHLRTPEGRALYQDLDQIWNDRTRRLNERLRAEALPVEVANLSSIWTVCYTRPSRYNWMLQYYLRGEGLALSWIGTGRLIFSLDYTDADFDAVADRFLAATKAMQLDGWWWENPKLTNKSIKRTVLKEMLARRLLPTRAQS